MYVAEKDFEATLNWFYQGDAYNYMMLFISSFDRNEESYIERIIDERIRINALTGSDICFFIFTEGYLIEPKDYNSRKTSEWVYSDIKSIPNSSFTRSSELYDSTLKSSIAIADDVCGKLNIQLSKLPAFVLIDKNQRAILFSTKDPDDLEYLLISMRILNRCIDDLTRIQEEKRNINNNLTPESIRRELKFLKDKKARIEEEKKLFENPFQDFLKYLHGKKLFNSSLEKLIMTDPLNIRRYLIEGIREFSSEELNISRQITNDSEFNNLYKKLIYAVKRMKGYYPGKYSSLGRDLQATNRSILDTEKSLKNATPESLNLLISETDNKLIEWENEYLNLFKKTIEISDSDCLHRMMDKMKNGMSPIPDMMIGMSNTLKGYSGESPVFEFEITEYTNDVFISAKSEDYKLVENVYVFLLENGYNPFIANETIRKLGQADYGKQIDSAINCCKHMIVFASRLDYISTTYVEYEWSLFNEELKTGRKNGNLLTILTDDVKIDDLPIALRNRQSLNFSSFKDDLLSFLRK